MLAVRSDYNNAEKIKKALIEQELFEKKFKVKRGRKYLYFPVIKKDPSLIALFPNIKYLQSNFVNSKIKKDYKDHLSSNVIKKEKTQLPSSFDILGDIIIIELGKISKKAEQEIGKALLNANKSIKTILKKSGNYEGEFRTRKLSFVAGEKRKETIYTENNTKLKLDVEKVYFSPRLSTERKRICSQIKKGESILVMFSGCGPYPLVISKNTKAKTIIGIEKNTIAHKYAVQNIFLNKTTNVEFINGDVREEVPKLKQKFDRILMPLPKGAEDFLDIAYRVSKKGTIIHFYDFEREEDFKKADEKVINNAKLNNKKIKILNTVKCGQYSPGKFRVCVDFIIL